MPKNADLLIEPEGIPGTYRQNVLLLVGMTPIFPLASIVPILIYSVKQILYHKTFGKLPDNGLTNLFHSCLLL